MLLSILGLCLTGAQEAEPTTVEQEPTEDTAAVVREQVTEVSARIEDQATKLDAIEHYLADKQRAQDGAVPDGWQQPPIAAYATPGAPPSFVPTVTQ